MYILENIEPKKVFRFFEEISRIPRGSGNEKEISDYLVQFAKDRNLEVYQDTALNVIIKKPATKGYENAPAVIMQGHIDMVCEKNQDSTHDFEKDPIKLIVEGDLIRADKTTLGADNGVAVALCLAVLDSSDLAHPALEIMLTSDEEVGMGGAIQIDGSLFKGKRFINLDCGPEGYFFAGCSGGLRQIIRLKTEEMTVPEGYKDYAVRIRGLKGGHSGSCIHKELGNSNKLLGRALHGLNKKFDFTVSHISGGSKDNAIPREADAVINLKECDAEKAKEFVKEFENVLKAEFRKSDPNVKLIFEPSEKSQRTFTKDCTDKIIKALMIIPYGLINKSLDIEGLTETSTNLGVVTTNEGYIDFNSATRSSVGSRKQYLEQQFAIIAELIGAEHIMANQYPAWEFNPVSPLRDLCMDTYRELFGKEPVLTATHGGLECGILSQKLDGVDIVAFGPDASGAHTPEENLSISSMGRTWQFLVKVLEKLK